MLIAVGTKDDIAGSAHELAAIIPGSEVLDIPGRDHMRAVGDKVYKEGVLAYLQRTACGLMQRWTCSQVPAASV